MGALSGQGHVPSSPCAGKWDLRGRSPSEQKQFGGQLVFGVLSWSQQRTGCQQGNRIPDVLSLKSVGLHYMNHCFGSGIVAWGRLAESWVPHNFGFLLKAEIWQLLLEN